MVGYGTIAPDQRRQLLQQIQLSGVLDPSTGTTLMCAMWALATTSAWMQAAITNCVGSSKSKNESPRTSIRLALHLLPRQIYDSNYFGVDPKVAYGPMNVTAIMCG